MASADDVIFMESIPHTATEKYPNTKKFAKGSRLLHPDVKNKSI